MLFKLLSNFLQNNIEVIEGTLLYLYLWVHQTEWVRRRGHGMVANIKAALTTLLRCQGLYLRSETFSWKSWGFPAATKHLSDSLAHWKYERCEEGMMRRTDGHTLPMKSLASYNWIVNNRGVRCSRNHPHPRFEIHSRSTKPRVRSGIHFSLLTY